MIKGVIGLIIAIFINFIGVQILDLDKLSSMQVFFGILAINISGAIAWLSGMSFND